MSFDVLQDKIKAKKNPTVAGLDARVEYVPPHILKKYTALHGETLQAAALAVLGYSQSEIAVALKGIDLEALSLEEVIKQALKKMVKP